MTSPSVPPTEDRLIGVLSRWLARDIPNERLRLEIEAIGMDGLGTGEAEAVAEVLEELRNGAASGRAQLERLVRETIEALALGV